MFYCLVFYCVTSVRIACLYSVFFIIFVTEVFERPSGEDSLVCHFYVLALQIHCVFSMLKSKRFVSVVSTWNTRGVFVGTLMEVSSPLTSFGNFDSFLRNKLIYYFY